MFGNYDRYDCIRWVSLEVGEHCLVGGYAYNVEFLVFVWLILCSRLLLGADVSQLW